MNRLPRQRQQAVLPKSTKDTPRYLLNQRRNLQRDWATVSKALTDLSMVGTAAQLPEPGQGGRFFLATDTFELYADSGNGYWIVFTGAQA
jgi:hypothetical protein